MPYQVRLTIFICASVIVGLAFFVWFFYAPIKRLVWRRNLAELFYAKVMKVARDGDYYLINKVSVKRGGSGSLLIDHILGGDKYIYVITDCYFEGAINAKSDDQRWVYFKKKGLKEDIVNPLSVNQFALESLSMQSGISSSFLVGIVLINDDCFVNRFDNGDPSSLLVPVSKLEKVVGAVEAKNVTPFVKKELWQTIHDLYELSEKNHGTDKKES